MTSVLIVDDEAGIREILRRWLEPAGYSVQQAADAEAALDVLASSVPAAVLCDVDMPGHDGLWLVARVRERFPTVAIVLATAADEVPPAVSLQDGVVGYVLKPFHRQRLLAAVKDAVAWHQAAVARASGQLPSPDA